jgi:hypothetical protein
MPSVTIRGSLAIVIVPGGPTREEGAQQRTIAAMVPPMLA